MRVWTGDIGFHLYEEWLIAISERNHVGGAV
jgi:hypothetical protein